MDNNHVTPSNNHLSHSVSEMGDRMNLLSVAERNEPQMNSSSRSLPSNYESMQNISRSSSSNNSVIGSKLNPSAQEFVPRSNLTTNVSSISGPYRHIIPNAPITNNHNYSNGGSSNAYNDNENYMEDYMSLSYLKDFINHISNKPSMYEDRINDLTLIINSYLDEDDCVPELIVNQIVDQSIIDGNFRYNGVRLCGHFMEHLRETSSGQSFKQLLFKRNQRECSRRVMDTTSPNTFVHLRGLALFTAELYSRCKEPDLAEHLPSLLINILSSDIKRDENIKCVYQVLMLCGQQMEAYFFKKGKPDFTNLIDKLRDTLKCDITSQTKDLVNKILNLVEKNWITPQTSVPSNLVNPYLNIGDGHFDSNNPIIQYNQKHEGSEFLVKQKLQWFPGHMRKGINDIGKVLKRTDCILEVHDARIPFSGRNIGLIKRMVANKPIILILNKSDLIPHDLKPIIKTNLVKEMQDNNICLEDVFFMDSISANAKRAGFNNKFLSTLINSIEKTPNIVDEMELRNSEKSYNLLVMGIPNVGKSTIINRLRNVYLNKGGKATITGPQAGVTKVVLERIKICNYPKKIYLFDSPGILEPSFHRFKNQKDQEIFMRCALCATLSDEIVGKELIADYLLYWLNKNSIFDYVEFLGAPSPTNDIIEALTYAAIKYNNFTLFKKLDTGKIEKVPAYTQLAEKFIAAFRKGYFGKFVLDMDLIEN